MARASETLLIRNASILATMDSEAREIAGGGMFIRDGCIEQVDVTAKLPAEANSIVDLSGHLVMPGFVNTHHHLYQTFDRACPGLQNAPLNDWLRGLYRRWVDLTPNDVVLATEIGLAELALSGCTTAADHHYMWPNGAKADDQFRVARRIGVRFHLGRGFQNIGAGSGGFAPPSILENDDDVLADCARLIRQYHDPSPGAMEQVFIAPSSVRSVTPQLLKKASETAHSHGVRFHMHLGETRGEIDYTRERFGKRPAEVAFELGCLSPQSWVAHGVHFDDRDIELLRRSGCGICHCPSSNMRLASGIAPIQRYLESGLTVGLGVDGSASNDSSNLLAEIRTALLLSRVAAAPERPLLDPRALLKAATVGGAKLLGRSDIGRLQPGYCADFIAFRLSRIELLPTEDPIAAVALCALTRVDHSWVHGRQVVKDSELLGVDHSALVERCTRRQTLQC
jgi:cytosine/adenosine deaminase-related metal-dependent hydrolase